jgi:hypothetical protein
MRKLFGSGHVRFCVKSCSSSFVLTQVMREHNVVLCTNAVCLDLLTFVCNCYNGVRFQ